MNLLLDTHAFLWFIAGDTSLSQSARAAIEDLGNNRYLSMASMWEIAIKISFGKLELSEPFEALIPKQLADNSIELLGISFEHTVLVSSMPFHHRDPFDRLLIAQSKVERMTLVSIDPAFDSYSVNRFW
ncbi:MAG: type II toxin-antitoxin system VapC family toxin [Chloroflexi bacterium]|nr:type II toxin-antitoxin system VapC family toxin [Chloroflexota bacterium]